MIMLLYQDEVFFTLSAPACASIAGGGGVSLKITSLNCNIIVLLGVEGQAIIVSHVGIHRVIPCISVREEF